MNFDGLRDGRQKEKGRMTKPKEEEERTKGRGGDEKTKGVPVSFY